MQTIRCLKCKRNYSSPHSQLDRTSFCVYCGSPNSNANSPSSSSRTGKTIGIVAAGLLTMAFWRYAVETHPWTSIAVSCFASAIIALAQFHPRFREILPKAIKDRVVKTALAVYPIAILTVMLSTASIRAIQQAEDIESARQERVRQGETKVRELISKGTQLVRQQKFEEAIKHWEEARDNPYFTGHATIQELIDDARGKHHLLEYQNAMAEVKVHLKSHSIDAAISKLSFMVSLSHLPEPDLTTAKKLLLDCQDSKSKEALVRELSTMSESEFQRFLSGAVPAISRYEAAELNQFLSSRLALRRGEASEIRQAELARMRELDLARMAELEVEKRARRLAEEKRSEDQAFWEEVGAKPENSAWDNSVACVIEHIKSNWHDPNSVEYIEWYQPKLKNYEGANYWAVAVALRGKNRLGAFVRTNKLFLIQRGVVKREVDLK